jgi:hypothetical protein
LRVSPICKRRFGTDGQASQRSNYRLFPSLYFPWTAEINYEAYSFSYLQYNMLYMFIITSIYTLLLSIIPHEIRAITWRFTKDAVKSTKTTGATRLKGPVNPLQAARLNQCVKGAGQAYSYRLLACYAKLL